MELENKATASRPKVIGANNMLVHTYPSLIMFTPNLETVAPIP